MEDRRSHNYKHIKEESEANYLIRPIKTNLNRKLSNKIQYLIVNPTIWDDIVSEDREFENFIRKEKLKNLPTFECASGYLRRELFPQLIPAFEMICAITITKSAHCQPVRFFDFIDALAEYLYNNNQRFKERKENWKSIHQVYKNEERTCYPYFWFINLDEAATMIQALVRGFLIRRRKILTTDSRQEILEGFNKKLQKDFKENQ